MRILKYLLLITILIAIGLVVFVSTQNANYSTINSVIIKSPKTTVYNYLFDYRNWETFDSRLSDKNTTSSYTESTWGKGSWVSWKGSSNGYIQTKSFKENDSICQKNVFNGENSQVIWKFKDTVGGTKVTWKAIGKIDFKSKVNAFFKGGVNRVLNTEFEENMVNLEKTLNYEMNTFSIKNIGLVNRVGCYYLKQTFNCKEPSINKNIKILLPRLKKFFKTNNIKTNGKPFILYSANQSNEAVIQVSICIPVKDSIFTAHGSTIKVAKLESYTAMKTRLTGDYSHTKKAWKSSFNYLTKNKIPVNPAIQISEVYWKEIETTRYPSKWETDIYIPVLPKKIIKKIPYKKRVVDTLATSTPSIQIVQ